MTRHGEALFAEWIAALLDEHGAQLVEAWIEGLQADVGRRIPRHLPQDALRNHMPPVLRSIAEALRTPLYSAHDDILGHLRLHAQMRRAQGYDVQELLSEFEDLFERIGSLLDEQMRDGASPDVEPSVVTAVMNRLFSLLRAIGFVTVGIYRDSEEEERTRLADQLEAFGRALAHELRTPLSTVQLGLETIRGGLEPAEDSLLARSLATMERAMARTQELLDDIRILALSKGRSPSQRRRVASIVHDVLEELALVADRKGVDVRNEVPDLEVMLDEGVAQLALINLISNAIKYTDPEASAPWVCVRARIQQDQAKGRQVVLEIEDNGVGVPPEVGEQIFQRHFRAHPQLAQGVGLGLAITKQLVDQSGGRLSLVSEAEQGACFRLILPGYVAAEGAPESPIGSNELLRDKATHQD